MSVHARPAQVLVACLTLALPAGVLSQTQRVEDSRQNAPSPGGSSAPARTLAPADGNPAAGSSVTKALSKLYKIPRGGPAQPRQFGTQRPTGSPAAPNATTSKSPRLGEVPPMPAPAGVSQQNRMGYQHSDAIRNSVSDLPIDDDLNKPPVGGHIVDPRRAPVAEPYSVITYGCPGGVYYGRSRLPESKRDWVDYRYFGGQPSRYGYGRYSDMYGIGDNPEGEYFRFGFMEGYDRGRWERDSNERVESVLAHAGNNLSRGIAAFRAGQYREAARLFKLASDMNQGDPAARIYAAHALFAIGRYQEGTAFLRRAFELEPRITMLTYNIRDDYPKKDEFEQQLAALEEAARLAPANLDRTIMLGYVLNYSGQPDRAYRVLSEARKKDKLAALLYEGTSPPDVKK